VREVRDKEPPGTYTNSRNRTTVSFASPVPKHPYLFLFRQKDFYILPFQWQFKVCSQLLIIHSPQGRKFPEPHKLHSIIVRSKKRAVFANREEPIRSVCTPQREKGSGQDNSVSASGWVQPFREVASLFKRVVGIPVILLHREADGATPA
jgi:hypothetical protein